MSPITSFVQGPAAIPEPTALESAVAALQLALPTVAGESILILATKVASLALLAAAVTVTAAFAFRLYTSESLPEGAALIIGLGTVGLALNTRNVLIQFIGQGSDGVSATVAAVELSMFVVAGIAASVGRLVGDRAATSRRFGPRAFGTNLGPMVRAVGRSITVELPAEIDDIDGYEPVADETKETLQGRTLDFPRGLTVDQLGTKLADRLRAAHDVGYVDLDLGPDGTVAHLGLGRRPAGLGPTLPPGTVAVAVRCDPAFNASPGDTVQLWRTDDGASRVGTGELRATVGDVATVVVDERVAAQVHPDVEYRLITLASGARPDREFAGILRRAEETMLTLEFAAGSPFVGNPIGALDVSVIAIRSAGGEIETLPRGDRTIRDGETLVVLGRPAELRQLQTAAATTIADAVPTDGAATNGESVRFRE